MLSLVRSPLRSRAARARVLGFASIASGVALALAPRATASALGLPPRPRLARALAVRDIAIGAVLVVAPRLRRAALIARGVSDAVDGMIILGAPRVARGDGLVRAARCAGAFALSAFALVTAARAQPATV